MAELSKAQLRERVRKTLGQTVGALNAALSGMELDKLEPVLTRLGRGGRLPHWFIQLKDEGTLPNLDGKTIGSIIEMLLLGILETTVLADAGIKPLSINPARGIDFPDLDLGVKSPSENYCTSEPFFSPYERLIGSEYDAVILLTDYQEKKKIPPLKLQVIKSAYLTKTQIADIGLCEIARTHRVNLLKENESWAKKIFRFLAFVNQSDWQATQLLRIITNLNQEDIQLRKIIDSTRKDFKTKNEKRDREGRDIIQQKELDAIVNILTVRPTILGIIDAADNWVIATHKDFGRMPNENEWQRLRDGPLDGKIGMSYALQWRYNFGRLFN